MDPEHPGWLDCDKRPDRMRCRPGHIVCRKHLIDALKDGAELEHYLMCMYLYAALSLKRYPDDTCDAAQIEVVRRWGNQIFMVARQEMEHLALVNGIFAAIGAPSYFVHSDDFHARPLLPFRLPVNFTSAANRPALEPKQFPFSLERFCMSTIETFTCLESPSWDQVRHKPDEPCWCFATAGESALEASGSKPAFRHFAPESSVLEAVPLLTTAPDQAGAGTVIELYNGIVNAIDTIPEETLFTGSRPQVAVIAQYDIFVTPITGRRSAKDAIHLILYQGEGNLTDPEITSHFTTFFNIRQQLKHILADHPQFDPALCVIPNPAPAKISNEFTRRMLELSADSYGTLLMVLTAVYDSFVVTGSPQDVYPHFSESLYESVFAPMMTMVIRKQGEILTLLPVGNSEERAGPSFDIPADVKEILQRQQSGNAPELKNIDTFVRRFEHLTDQVKQLQSHIAQVPPDVRGHVSGELEFLYQNAYRMANNLKHTYQQGKFSNF